VITPNEEEVAAAPLLTGMVDGSSMRRLVV